MDDDEGMPRDADRASRAERESVFLLAQVETSNVSFVCKVRNVSATGAFVQTDMIVPASEPLTLVFKNGISVMANVVRNAANGFGIQFLEAIDPASIRSGEGPISTETQGAFLLNLREGFRRPIWDNSGDEFKRPGLRSK